MKNKLKRPLFEKILYLFMGLYTFISPYIGDSKFIIALWFISAVCIFMFFLSFIIHQITFNNDVFELNETFSGKIIIKKSEIKKIEKNIKSKTLEIHLINGDIVNYKPSWPSKKNINNIQKFFDTIISGNDL